MGPRSHHIGGESLSQALCDVTLVNLSHLAYSYPMAIEDLMLHEHEVRSS